MKQPKRRRCWNSTNLLLLDYHDNEWGAPARDDRLLFEHLILGGFQAGLSWGMILNKRENFRKAFAAFDPRRVAGFKEREIRRLLSDPGIVRNRVKIQAAIGNARAFIRVQMEFGSFANYAWDFIGGKPIRKKHPGGDLPARTPESDAFSEDLKTRGFRFVGSTIVYAFMQSVGLVNDHRAGCWRLKNKDG
ncbi:MAG TPA: DNA-3-methyladenine glycosylase I [Nitrospiria bacterium]|nr:DNA-3-methyladenine glycosylase I [Nitrospiria bacterium]